MWRGWRQERIETVRGQESRKPSLVTETRRDWPASLDAALGRDENPHFSLNLATEGVLVGEGNGNPLQCSCLENPRDRGAWWAATYGGCTESDMTEAT